MYIVRNRKTQRIIHVNKAPLSAKLKAKDVYPTFDAEVMELLKTDLDALPAYFEVDRHGKIKVLSLEQQVKSGKRVLQPHQKLKGGAIVSKTLEELVKEGHTTLNEPFEYLKNGKRAKRTAAQLIQQKLISKPEHLDAVVTLIDRDTITAIEGLYPPRTEIRITKNFALWMYAGRPKDDDREQAMLDMESFIQSVRADAAQLKATAASLVGAAAKPKKSGTKKPKPAAPKAAVETPIVPAAKPVADSTEQPDEYWTVARLRVWMTDRGIAFVNRDKKPELLEKINAASA